MNAYIYQLPIKENACFRGLDTVLSVEKKIDLNKYEVVGYIPVPEKVVETLTTIYDFKKLCENLYSVLNWETKPDVYCGGGRSLSVSDIIGVDGKFFYCDDIGFKEIQFDAENIYRG